MIYLLKMVILHSYVMLVYQRVNDERNSTHTLRWWTSRLVELAKCLYVEVFSSHTREHRQTHLNWSFVKSLFWLTKSHKTHSNSNFWWCSSKNHTPHMISLKFPIYLGEIPIWSHGVFAVSAKDFPCVAFWGAARGCWCSPCVARWITLRLTGLAELKGGKWWESIWEYPLVN